MKIRIEYKRKTRVWVWIMMKIRHDGWAAIDMAASTLKLDNYASWMIVDAKSYCMTRRFLVEQTRIWCVPAPSPALFSPSLAHRESLILPISPQPTLSVWSMPPEAAQRKAPSEKPTHSTDSIACPAQAEIYANALIQIIQ